MKDDKTFASLLGGEKPAKTASASKKLPSGAASLQAKTYDDVARFSQSGSDKSASSQADNSPASDVAIPNQTNQAQFIAAVSLASYIPISSAEKDVSVTQSSPSAEANPASQASRPLLQPTPATKGLHSSTGAAAAQDTRTMNSGTRSYETAGDKQASRAPISVSERTTAAAAVSSSATDTAATSLKTPLAPDAPAMDRVPRSPEPALASKLAAAVSSSATDTAATSLKIPLAPDAPAMDRVPKNPKPTLAPKLAAAQMAKSSEAPSSRSLLSDTNSAQSGKITSNANSDGLKISVSDAQSGITSKMTMPPSSDDPVEAPDAVVVVRSQTHFVPEAVKAGDDITGQITTLSSAQDQVVAAGQVTFPPSPKQLDSEPSTAITSPQNDVTPKIAVPALTPNQTGPSQTVAFPPSRTKAEASSTEQRFNMTTDGSSFADTQAENSANTVSASRLNVTPNAGGGGNPHDGSARDEASHNHPGGEQASAPTEAPRSSEVGPAIPLGTSAMSSSTPAQQLLDEIQRAIPAGDNSQALTSALPPTLDGQQPLKTITVALSPASLGTVAVELSFKGGQLSVKLQVQEAGTVQLLRQDGSLEKLLESAGYTVQSLSFHLSPQANQPPQAGQPTANGQSFSNQFSSSGSGQEQGSSQSNKGQPTDRNADQRPGHGRTEDFSGNSSLYV